MRQLPYPPPWQDAPTLCAHLCISEGTLDNWIRQQILPPAKMRGGKRMWEWSEVDSWMRGNGITMGAYDNLTAKVFHATKAAQNG